jgi:hypothetical protein
MLLLYIENIFFYAYLSSRKLVLYHQVSKQKLEGRVRRSKEAMKAKIKEKQEETDTDDAEVEKDII